MPLQRFVALLRYNELLPTIQKKVAMGHLASREGVYPKLTLNGVPIVCILRATPLTVALLDCNRQQLNTRSMGGLCEAENAAEYNCYDTYSGMADYTWVRR
jgi:hypothetical protein